MLTLDIVWVWLKMSLGKKQLMLRCLMRQIILNVIDKKAMLWNWIQQIESPNQQRRNLLQFVQRFLPKPKDMISIEIILSISADTYKSHVVETASYLQCGWKFYIFVSCNLFNKGKNYRPHNIQIPICKNQLLNLLSRFVDTNVKQQNTFGRNIAFKCCGECFFSASGVITWSATQTLCWHYNVYQQYSSKRPAFQNKKTGNQNNWRHYIKKSCEYWQANRTFYRSLVFQNC